MHQDKNNITNEELLVKQQREFEAYKEYENNKKKKKWLWGCGSGCGCLILLAIIMISISACTASFNSESTNTSKNNKAYKIGETVKNGDLEITVNSVENSNAVGPSISPTNAKDMFVVANVKIKNKNTKSLTVDSTMFKLKSGNNTYDADNVASMSANQKDDGKIEDSFFLEQVNPDSTTEGNVVFDVSENVANTKDKKLEITSSLFNSKSVLFDLSDK